jgi:hypothetical protein
VDADADRAPSIPSDLEDHDRDQKADNRVTDFPAESNEGCARDDAQGDEAVHAGMLSVGNEGGTAQSFARMQADPCGQFVAQEKPMSPAPASAHRCESSSGWKRRWIVSKRATQAETKIPSTTA